MKRIKIQGGRVIDPANKIDAPLDLYVAHGVIVALGAPPEGFQPDQIIRAEGQIVCPGLIDLGARLSGPGELQLTSIASETAAAAKSGITTLCCQPDTVPPLDKAQMVEWIQQSAKQNKQTHVLTLAALSQQLRGNRPSELAALKSVGCIATSDAGSIFTDLALRRHCFEYAATFDLKIFIHAQEPSLVEKGCVHEGIISARSGLRGIPETAETVAIARDLLLLEQTGATAHFCCLSSARAVELIAQAQAGGAAVTADVAAHQLHLTEVDVSDFDSNCHVFPPLRSESDRVGLARGLTRGVISSVCSDHQPCSFAAKQLPFSQSALGISALETLLPLVLRLMKQNSVSFIQALGWVTQHPATILGIKAGTLAVGATADICIFDPNAIWTLAQTGMVSLGHNTPFLNWQLQGQVNYTLLGGMIVYQNCST